MATVNVRWLGGAGDWDSTNWSTGSKPGAGNTAVIGAGSTVTASMYDETSGLLLDAASATLNVTGILMIGTTRLAGDFYSINSGSGSLTINAGGLFAGQFIDSAAGTVYLNNYGTYQWNGSGSSQVIDFSRGGGALQFSTQFDGTVRSFGADDFISYSGTDVVSSTISANKVTFNLQGGGTRTVNFTGNYNASNLVVSENIITYRDAPPQPVSYAPVVTTSTGTAAATEQTPTPIDPSLTLADADSSTLASAAVSITTGYVAGQDRLAFSANSALYGNIQGNASGATLTLTSADNSATLAQFQAALRSVTFTADSDAPSTATRTIQFTASDGINSSAVATRNVTVAAVNDAPSIAGVGDATLDDDAVGSRFADLQIIDPDVGQTLSARVGFDPAVGSLSNSSGTGTLTANAYTVSGSRAAVEAALRNVVYTPIANRAPPGQATQTALTLSLTDGVVAQPTTASVTLTINSINDAPTAVADTAAATEAGGIGNATPGSDAAGNVLANDTDADTGDTKTVTAVGFNGTPGSLGSMVAGAYGSLTLNGNGSYSYQVDNSSAAVQALASAGNTLTDTFSYTMADGAGATSSTTLAVTIAGANDAATFTTTGATAVTEDTGVLPDGRLAATGTISVDDVDAGESTFRSTVTPVGNTLGTLALSGNGASLDYTYSVANSAVQYLNTGESRTESFLVFSSDGTETTLSFVVNGQSEPPSDDGGGAGPGNPAGGSGGQGSEGNDDLIGTPGDDTISLLGGDDRYLALEGNDVVFGNMGNDAVFGNQGNDSLWGGMGQDSLFGGQGDDWLSGDRGDDLLFGNLGADLLLGGMGTDTLYGGQGNDTLYGGQGNDVLYGDLGDDVLSGDLGADRYVFGANSGRDLILGFSQADGDRIDLQGQTYRVDTDTDGSARLTLSGGGTVDLRGVQASAVNAGFFA
ncbi:VCBS domain-containing protein [Methylobacterium sp. A54F]